MNIQKVKRNLFNSIEQNCSIYRMLYMHCVLYTNWIKIGNCIMMVVFQLLIFKECRIQTLETIKYQQHAFT